jgi:spore germination protein YaaH
LNMAHYTPPRRKRRFGLGKLVFLLFSVAFLATILVVGVWRFLWPNGEHITPSYGADKPIFYQGQAVKGSAMGEGDELTIPLSAIQELLDPNIQYEEATKSVIITTKQHVVRLQSQQLNAWVNEQPVELRFPVEEADGGIYVPIEPLQQFYGAKFAEDRQTGAVTVTKPGDILAWVEPQPTEKAAEVVVPVREEPTVRAPIIGEFKSGEKAALWSEEDGWYRVQLPNGYVGFAEKKSIRLAGTEVYSAPEYADDKEFVPSKTLGQRIMAVWEQVHTKTPDPSKFGPMPGLNTVSPTWFHLLDGEGALENRADAAYVKWAHNRGYRVWALFSNRFDPALTAEALSTYDRRMTMARQLVSWVELYKLDGINIDFENVNLEDGPKLTQFVRELTPLLHEAGATVSIDVTFVSSSENWSMFYDRKALAEVVDYMMLMAYDEHWASSPVSGSVASLPWVENGLTQIMNEYGVPANKIILGVPFYTRVWLEQTVDGKLKVSSKAVGMDAVLNIIEKHQLSPKYDEASGQNYVEYQEDGAVKKIWLEDETSMKARAELVLKYRLAGMAAWSRGFENPPIWETIDSVLQSYDK